MSIILGIESSCDETAAAITRDGKLLASVISSQADIHAKYGGVMPEVASRLHVENIGVVLKETMEKAGIGYEDIDAIAFTRGPGLIGSLHAGVEAAKALALLYKKPLVPVHHLAGHIYANEYVDSFSFPLLAVVVSGGNTELVLMERDLEFKIIGETKDDAVGESFDKVARIVGLPYPGGLPIDQHAKKGKPVYDFPIQKLHHIPGTEKYDYSFSYSGLKTAVLNFVEHKRVKGESYDLDDLCASFEKAAIDPVVERMLSAAKECKVKQVVLAGGVSANSYLRSEAAKALEGTGIHLTIPPLWCTTDNAAMIAKVGEKLFAAGVTCSLDIDVDPNWQIEDYREF